MRPVVGITPSTDGGKYKINHDYCDAVIKSGGTPVILPYDMENIDELLLSIDAVLLSGGGDVHSKFYNEPLHGLAKDVQDRRDQFEISLCNSALQLDKPLLCICRGMQVLNVATGGTLIQHIAGHVQKKARDLASHEVEIAEDTPLFYIYEKNTLNVNSMHHQAVLMLGTHIVSCAKCSDGIIEGIYYKGAKFAVGVQWHPESMTGDPLQQKLFDGFIQSCYNGSTELS